MLTKPKHGWTGFSLEGSNTFSLSYLDNIAFEWIEHAIHGLDTMQPFCVKGYLEPNRLLCTVSYWNCYIIIENDGPYCPVDNNCVSCGVYPTSMIEFCKNLYNDICLNIEEWAKFSDYSVFEEFDIEKSKKLLEQKLDRLKELILEREKCFGEDRCFL